VTAALAQAAHADIAAEFEAVRGLGLLRDQHEGKGAGGSWQQLPVHPYCETHLPKTCAACRAAAATQRGLYQPEQIACKFSVLQPGAAANPHHGPTNGKLRVWRPRLPAASRALGPSRADTACLARTILVWCARFKHRAWYRLDTGLTHLIAVPPRCCGAGASWRAAGRRGPAASGAGAAGGRDCTRLVGGRGLGPAASDRRFRQLRHAHCVSTRAKFRIWYKAWTRLRAKCI
jgi:hypothetical protein